MPPTPPGADRELKEPPAHLIGGDGYPDTVPRSAADFEVLSQAELVEAGNRASPGDVIYLTDDIHIEVGGGGEVGQGTSGIELPGNITLAGDRGINGSPGPRLYATQHLMPMVEMGDNVRVTGIRLEGPDPFFDPYISDDYVYPAGIGIRANGNNIEFDNIDGYGWAHSALQIYGGGEVHDCYLHHNPQDALGYGVMLTGGGHTDIYRTAFDYNRHAVATTNSPTSWTLENSWCGPDTVHHVLDHHGASGAEVVIRNVTVEATHNIEDPEYDSSGHSQEAVDFRDEAPDRLVIENSWFFHSGPGSAFNIAGGVGGGNVSLRNNHYGSSDPGDGIGHPRSAVRASFTADTDGLTVSLDASASSADSGIATYEWDVDGARYTDRTVEHTFDSEGSYPVSLTVTATSGDTATTTQEVPVRIGLPGSPTETRSMTITGPTGTDTAFYTFDVRASQDGTPGIEKTGEGGPGADPDDDVFQVGGEPGLWRCEGGAALGGTDTYDVTGYFRGFESQGSYSFGVQVNGQSVDPGELSEEPSDDDDGDDDGGGLTPSQRALLSTVLSGAGTVAADSVLR